MENPMAKWDDLGGKPTIFGNIQIEIEVSYATAARSFMCLGPPDPERVTSHVNVYSFFRPNQGLLR